MKTFISMLRGINVSGKRMIRMPELANLYHELGFNGVATYIQSGNVIFNTDKSLQAKDLAMLIEKAILDSFGFDVPVIIRTPEELAAVIEANPFHNADGTAKDKIYITFLDALPLQENLDKIKPYDYYPDKFVFIAKEIYLDCAGGYGTTKLSNTFFENRLKVRATARNWKTVNTLLQMATV
jgi:uncharacterized protein (DUF1697 family)